MLFFELDGLFLLAVVFIGGLIHHILLALHRHHDGHKSGQCGSDKDIGICKHRGVKEGLRLLHQGNPSVMNGLGNGKGTDENFWTTTHNYFNYASVNIFKIEPHPTSKIDSTAPQPLHGDYSPFCHTGGGLTPEERSSLACFINAELDSRISVRCLSNIQECNGTAFDNTKQFCQDGAIYDLCQKQQYDGTKYECRNDTIYERGTDSVYKISWKILNPQKTYGLFQDPRDGQYYKTITVEGSTWFAENLNYDVPGSICYDNKPSYCDIYGRMYTQKQALGGIDTVPDHRTEGICPPGTHLVTLAEYNALQEAYGTEGMFSSYIENNLVGEYRTFTNNSGVSLLFGGYYNKNEYITYYLEEWSYMSRAGYSSARNSRTSSTMVDGLGHRLKTTTGSTANRRPPRMMTALAMSAAS